jgi:hypothetical protein
MHSLVEVAEGTHTHEKHMGSLMLTQAIPSPSHGRSPEVSAMAANCWLMLLCNFLPDLIPTHVPPFVLPCLTLLCPCPTLCPIVSNLVLPKSNLVSYLVLPMSSCLSYHARSYPCPTSCPTSSHPHPTPCPTMSDPVQPCSTHVQPCPAMPNLWSEHVRAHPTHVQPLVLLVSDLFLQCPTLTYPCPTSHPTPTSNLVLPCQALRLTSYYPSPTLCHTASDLVLPCPTNFHPLFLLSIVLPRPTLPDPCPPARPTMSNLVPPMSNL